MLDVAIETALAGFTLSVEWAATSHVVALFGASGAGKTLTLQCLAGLRRPDRGRIVVDGETYFDAARRIDVPARARRVGYVFQGYALFPHLTVAENIAYGLASQPRAARRSRVDELLARLDLSDLARARPATLSGGQQQRVALGRAIAPRPRLLLLDEPLSALDAPLRRQLRDDLARTLHALEMTTVLVTHDVSEALHLADHIVVYDAGRVVQQSAKSELLSRPTSASVARLLGVRNILRARVCAVGETSVVLDWMGHALIAARSRATDPPPSGCETAFSLQPEYLRIEAAGHADAPMRDASVLTGVVLDTIDAGTTYTLRFAADGARGAAPPPAIEVDVPRLAYEMLHLARDRRCTLSIPASAVQLLATAEGGTDGDLGAC